MRMVRLNVRPQLVGPDGLPIRAGLYDAASTGRRLSDFPATASGPNAHVLGELDILRHRARHLLRNNPWIRNGIQADVANEIGTGIRPRPATDDEAINDELLSLWREWQYEADADSIHGFYALQALIARARRESGEVFIRIRRRRPEDGLTVPVQIQVLEADYCPLTLNQTLKNGNRIISGIEFNRFGRRVAYWLYKVHPLDASFTQQMAEAPIRVPAEQIIHHFIPSRPGQIRGEPVMLSAMTRAWHFDAYDDAELERKKQRAAYTGVIKRPMLEEDWEYNPITGEKLSNDDYAPIIDTQPGQFAALMPGEDIELFPGDQTGQGYADFVRQQLLGIAAGLGVPYELVTGDYKEINDRIWRSLINQYRRRIEQEQQVFIRQVCRPVWHAFVDAAVLAGAVEMPGYARAPARWRRAEWRTQAWPHIHPLQDVQAMVATIEAGLDSRQSVVAGRGRDVEQVDAERAADARREKELGLDGGDR